MLKPMKPQKKTLPNIYLWAFVALLVISGVIVMVVAFRGNDDGTDEVNAVYTNAAATLAAQQLTLQASAPSATPTTAAQTPTATFTPLVSPTLLPTLASAANPSSNPVSGAVGCNNSRHVADVTFPDNTVVTPGQVITKTWKLENTGTCPWTPTFKVTFLSGDAMNGVATPIGVTVQPGQSADISVTMTAPATVGDAKGTWILTTDTGQNFGTTFFILVKVGSTTGTATATATATSAATAPTAASNLAITLTCTLGGTGGTQKEHAGTLTWTDNSTNETGFNIYINSVFAATVASNTTSFGVPAGTFYDTGVPSTFAVEAINGSLKATQATVTVSCP